MRTSLPLPSLPPQIHKLIAGLDFLEQHIIRQDAVIDGVQKQAMMVGGGVGEAGRVG